MDPEALERKRCVEFLAKVYKMVDEPSTDSIISWGPNGDTFIVSKPLECCRDLLPKYLGLSNFILFQNYGFKKVVESRLLEYACEGFVKDQPEGLEKIAKRREEKFNEECDKLHEERMKQMRSKEDRKRHLKEMLSKLDEKYSKDVERFMQTVAYEREWRREAFPKELEDRLQLVLDTLQDLINSTNDLVQV
ncbi:PREDICTED: heat stress transcription factor A-4b-like [Camelina sativa]|uniref:Heat stress transcription factor A-4b-like n=1 Tax=Camelina sativa TaxID=90675 RepID=A0ABM0V1C8_CAMSA|nr:PREDICTED: heat stress transcription factor A-4b-like [Camelina sativa]